MYDAYQRFEKHAKRLVIKGIRNCASIIKALYNDSVNSFVPYMDNSSVVFIFIFKSYYRTVRYVQQTQNDFLSLLFVVAKKIYISLEGVYRKNT